MKPIDIDCDRYPVPTGRKVDLPQFATRADQGIGKDKRKRRIAQNIEKLKNFQ